MTNLIDSFDAAALSIRISELERENAALRNELKLAEQATRVVVHLSDEILMLVKTENTELRTALNKIAADPATAVTHFEVKWQQIARDALKSND